MAKQVRNFVVLTLWMDVDGWKSPVQHQNYLGKVVPEIGKGIGEEPYKCILSILTFVTSSGIELWPACS